MARRNGGQALRFSIIIPNYNNGPWLDKCLDSIVSQKYNDYEVIFVDDVSTDNSVDIFDKYKAKFRGYDLVELHRKHYNGGARNVGISCAVGDYIVFIDSDDSFYDNMCLKAIDDAVRANNEPDLVRLSYVCCVGHDEYLADLSGQDTVEKILASESVACWTKCVKRSKMVQFPENTLMEDVVQHIAQLDNVDSVAVCDKPIIKWNRNNTNSCSTNPELQDGKWRSSLYRFYADLLDLKVNKPESQFELAKRRSMALDNIRNGRYEQ